jgi:dUTP pyrophosphatase
MLLEYAKVRDNVRAPSRAHPSDAGLDVFLNVEKVGDCQVRYLHGGVKKYGIVIQPGESKILPTGIRLGIPHGYYVRIENRSSMSAKHDLLVGGGVVDAGYDGEIKVIMHNVGKEPQFIAQHEKIAQLVMIPCVSFRAIETSSGDLYDWYPLTVDDGEKRGEGGFGSTDEQE